jgi:hypothetical protein
LAESDDTVVVEGNQYFPAAALRREHFRDSATHTVCPWKGTASYYDVVVGDAGVGAPVVPCDGEAAGHHVLHRRTRGSDFHPSGEAAHERPNGQ